jgi:hypothetical protein
MIPIRGQAYQRFLANGPLALLPSNLPQYSTIYEIFPLAHLVLPKVLHTAKNLSS